MLATVLSPLHRPVEAYGGPRHENLLGPRVHDLHPEPTTDVGGDHLDAVDGKAELCGNRLPHAGRSLWGGMHQQRLVVRVTPGQDTFALHRHRRAALDL